MMSLDGADFEIISTNKIPPAKRLIAFSSTCSLLLQWQASLTGNVVNEAANRVVSNLHRLCTFKILKPLLVSLMVT